jgi:hypothetical protein
MLLHCIIKHCDMKMYMAEVKVELQSFMTFTSGGGESSVSCISCCVCKVLTAVTMMGTISWNVMLFSSVGTCRCHLQGLRAGKTNDSRQHAELLNCLPA